MKLPFPFFGALVLAAPAAGVYAAPREVTLDEAIRTATERDPRVDVAAANVEAAEATRASGRARFLPVLRLEGNVQVWNDAVDVSFAGGDGQLPALPPPQTPYEVVVAGLLQGLSGSTRVRDQVTADSTVAVVQPLTPLLVLGPTHELLDLGVSSAASSREIAERDAALGAVSAYLRTLQALALERSARQAVADIDAQLARVQALLEGGMVRESDRLRLEVARAAAEQDAIVVGAGVRMSRAALATAMRLPTDAEILPAPLPAATCASSTTPVAELQQQALERRPELAQLRATAQQADRNVSVARNQLWPMLTANAAYLHVEGQQLTNSDQAFVGLNLQWNAFEWGATRAQVDEAAARARQAQAGIAQLEDGVRLSVEQSAADLDAAARALSVAALAEQQAVETLRIESDRYSHGDATATDVVTAESALRVARNRSVAARHQCLLAQAALRASVGAPLTAEMFAGGQ